MGKVLILVGATIMAIGIAMVFLPKGWGLGRLPGDIVIERPSLNLYIPITTSIAVSIFLTLGLLLFRWIRNLF